MRGKLIVGLGFFLVLAVWLSQLRGTVSSNDGSHLALARALAVHEQTSIENDAWRTLGVDLAAREGRPYSDRPPGTAFLALGAARLGARLDEEPSECRWIDRRSELYWGTVRARFPGAPAAESECAGELVLGLHGVLIGLVGLFALSRVLALRGAGAMARASVVVGLGLCTAYASYATMLFSHVSACAMLFLCWWACCESATDSRQANLWAALAGLCGAWAVACEYSLIVAMVPTLVVGVSRKRWLWMAAGGLMIAAATAAYHQAAFDSPFAIGYDFHVNFAFARSGAGTFSGNPFTGAWTLFGTGKNAGLLALSPVVLVGLALALRQPESSRAEALAAGPSTRALALCLVPWLALICFHRTPWGGHGQDYRYILPVLGIAALALGEREWSRPFALGLAALTLLSGGLWWAHFLERAELSFVSSPRALLWAPVLVLVAFGLSRLPALASTAREG